MSTLTAGQQATLKTYIEANPVWMGYAHNSDGAYQIAIDLQADSSFVVWRTNVPETDYTNEESSEATNWSWVVYMDSSVSERAGYDRMFLNGFVNPSKVNIRSGFMDIFSSGQPPVVAQLAHMMATSKRLTNLLEELFATGTGTTLNPGIMVIEGSINYREIVEAMEW